MQIELRIASILHNKAPALEKNLAGDKWELSKGTVVGDILQILNLTDTPTILVVNNRQVNKKTILKDGDLFRIFSAVSGG